MANSAARVSPSFRALLSVLLQFADGLIRLSQICQIGRYSQVRSKERGVNRQCFAILRDGVIELSLLQQHLGVGVVRVGIVGNQFDVFLEGLAGAGVVALLPVGIAENVVRRGVIWGQFGGLLSVLNGLRHILLAKIIVAHSELRALITWICGNQLIEIVLLLGGVAIGARLSRQNEQFFALRKPCPPG